MQPRAPALHVRQLLHRRRPDDRVRRRDRWPPVGRRGGHRAGSVDQQRADDHRLRAGARRPGQGARRRVRRAPCPHRGERRHGGRGRRRHHRAAGARRSGSAVVDGQRRAVRPVRPRRGPAHLHPDDRIVDRRPPRPSDPLGHRHERAVRVPLRPRARPHRRPGAERAPARCGHEREPVRPRRPVVAPRGAAPPGDPGPRRRARAVRRRARPGPARLARRPPEPRRRVGGRGRAGMPVPAQETGAAA